jgi:hypothetical protein
MRLRASLRGFAGRRDGAALVEFTLMVPMLLALAAGVTEMGLALHQQHVVTKSVRDAARFAARQFVAAPSCPLSTVTEWATIQSETQQVALRGSLSGSAPFLLSNWNQTSHVTVSDACSAAGALVSPAGAGANIPVITVSADVPFAGVGFLGFIGMNAFTIRASHSEMWVGL